MDMIFFVTDENIPKAIVRSINEISAISHSVNLISTVDIDKLGKAATDQQIIDYLTGTNPELCSSYE